LGNRHLWVDGIDGIKMEFEDINEMSGRDAHLMGYFRFPLSQD
jgi:hypothetical protein